MHIRGLGLSFSKPSAASVPENNDADLATAILRRKTALNKLMVDESPQDNNSMIYLSESTLEKLGLFRSDTVLLKGKLRRETIAVVLASPDCDDNKIKMNKGTPSQILHFLNF